MSDAWNSIKIREFEHVLATRSVALLRVSGRPSRRRSEVGPRPVLLVDDGQTVRRFAAIPSPPDKRGLLRTAYSVSSDLVAPGTAFSLELTDGSLIALPAPQPGAARLIREPDVEPPTEPAEPSADPSAEPAEPSAELAEPAEPPPGQDERRLGLVSQLTELSALLAESEQARGSLEAAVSEARIETERANEQVASQRADLANLEDRRAEADRRADELQRVCQQLEQDVAEAVAARDELDESIAPLRAARERAEHELAEAHDAVRKMTFERDELTRQASAFDAVAVKARERAAEAEAEAAKATASAQELDTWSGELERRLTDTTDELSAAKAAHERDVAELRRLGGEFAEAEAKVELLQAQVKTLNAQLAANGQPPSDAPGPPPIPRSPSERERIAREAGELAARLAGAERLTELVSELSAARTQAESLQAALQEAISAEPGTQAAPDDDALSSAYEEIDQLRGQLAQARDAGDDARIDAIRHAAEAEARELAERELAQATRIGK
jgi:chromosome segregation ATPase